MKRLLMLILLILVLAGCSSTNQETSDNTSDVADLQETKQTVVIVNDEEIYQEEVDTLKQQLSMQNQQMNESAVIEQLVAKTLLLQEAKARGLNVSDAEAESQLSQMLSQRGASIESVKQRVPEEQFSMLLKQQKEQLMLQRLAEDAANSSVTEDAVRQAYEDNKEQMQNATYEQAAPRIKEILQQNAQQKALSVLAEKLRQNADVVYK